MSPSQTPEARHKYYVEYYQKNREKLLLYQKKYQESNREKLALYYRKYYKKRTSSDINYVIRLREYARASAKRNRQTARKYVRNKRKTDASFRLISSIRNSILQAIKKSKKSAKTMQLVGCSLEQLKSHLQSKWTTGMSWENYGYWGWHVDHIMPCASFDMSDPAQQRLCFHYSNLQPLWRIDNQRKHSKIPN